MTFSYLRHKPDMIAGSSIMSDLTKSNPKAVMIRVEPKNSARYAGQRRHDLRIGHQPAYVDMSRAYLNRVLIEPLPPAQLRAICEERRHQRETTRAMKSNASVAMTGLIGFGSEAQELFLALTIEQQDTALREASETCAARMRTTVAGLVVHCDESSPHAHVTFPAYDIEGQPLTETVKRAILKGLQDDVAEVIGRYAPGIERGRSRMDRLAAGADYAETVHRSVRELHRDLPAEIEMKRKAVADLSVAEDAARVRVDEMQRRVDDLHARADLSNKEVKRLATYERRLSDRLKELRKAQVASEEARSKADSQAEAQVRGLEAVVAESEAGTLRRSPNGGMLAADPKILQAGGPSVVRAAQVLISIQDKASKVNASLKRAQQRENSAILAEAAAVEREQEAAGLVTKLKRVISQVKNLLSRSDLPTDAKIYGHHVERDAEDILSSEKSGDDSAGPGF